MREIREILKQICILGDDERAVLATVVDLKGSGYRLPGARMLITSDGDAIGTVSGGCLEADVLEGSKRVLETGRTDVFVYDTTIDENSVFSLNMGCRGVLRILLEPVTAHSDIAVGLRQVNEERKRLEAATLIDSGSFAASRVGERIIVDRSSGDILGSRSILRVVPQLRDDLLTFATSRSAFDTIEYQVESALMEFSFETLNPPILLIIFGAGADAVPLAEIAAAIGWKVTVYDHRPAFLTKERFPIADNLVLLDRDEKIEIPADDRTAIVSMNHNYDRDREVIRAAIYSDAFYIGALGPKKRTHQLLNELEADGEAIDKAKLSSLRSPAGLDIGGDSPETIAVSIVAEIQSALKHRSGGPLQERDAPIYDRKQES